MVIASIDLMGGKAVQMEHGRRKVLERDDPLALGRAYSRLTELAVIDLDAAMERGHNEELIRRLCRESDCRVGGGVRTVNRAAELVSAGAGKVIVGTAAFTGSGINDSFLRSLRKTIGRQRIIIALDSWGRRIMTHGWQRRSGIDCFSILKEAEPYCCEFLFTCVDREGMMKGTNMDLVKRIRNRTDREITVAGGISSANEVETLAAMNVNTQLGMALYTGKLPLDRAISAALNWREGLIPVIAVDCVGQVLMLANMSRESLERTLETGDVWYFSRSRGSLWRKGATSGNTQRLVRLRSDCDGDALLLTVDQTGAACHSGSYSCFGDRSFSFQELRETIDCRISRPTAGSYTAGLTDRSVRKKLLEEAGELVAACGNEEVVWEAADVIYFMMVLLAREGVAWPQVMAELRRRRRRVRPAPSGGGDRQ